MFRNLCMLLQYTHHLQQLIWMGLRLSYVRPSLPLFTLASVNKQLSLWCSSCFFSSCYPLFHGNVSVDILSHCITTQTANHPERPWLSSVNQICCLGLNSTKDALASWLASGRELVVYAQRPNCGWVPFLVASVCSCGKLNNPQTHRSSKG